MPAEEEVSLRKEEEKREMSEARRGGRPAKEVIREGGREAEVRRGGRTEARRRREIDETEANAVMIWR